MQRDLWHRRSKVRPSGSSSSSSSSSSLTSVSYGISLRRAQSCVLYHTDTENSTTMYTLSIVQENEAKRLSLSRHFQPLVYLVYSRDEKSKRISFAILRGFRSFSSFHFSFQLYLYLAWASYSPHVTLFFSSLSSSLYRFECFASQRESLKILGRSQHNEKPWVDALKNKNSEFYDDSGLLFILQSDRSHQLSKILAWMQHRLRTTVYV